jgi:hypothetical protein
MCSRCVGPDGAPWRNRGSQEHCRKCKVHKGKCFGGKVGKPSGTSPTVSSRKAPGSKVAQSENQKTRLLEIEVKKLKEQLKAKPVAAADPPAGHPAAAESTDEGVSEADKQAAKALQKRIQSLKDMDTELRGILCESKGGFAAYLAQLEDELRQTWARHRGQKPLAQQKASAEAHFKRRQKIRDEAADELKKLTEVQTELEAKIVKQKAALEDAETALQQAKLETLAISERATAELRGDGQSASYTQSSVVTAATVKDFFTKLPAAVVQHEEGQQTIAHVMALLEKLDAAAKVAAASGQAAAPAATGGCLPAQLVAAATPPAAGNTTAQVAVPDEDEEMDDTALASAMPNTDQEELLALKMRLKEQGIWIRCTRPRSKIGKK